MLSNTLHTIVEAAVNAELIDAKRSYGDHYASPHEGYGVLMEELHEATVELRDLDSAVTEQLIEDMHEDDLEGMVCTLADVELTARRLACEAIQVAAVARKMSETCAAMMAAPPPAVTGTPEQLLKDATPVQRFLWAINQLLNSGKFRSLSTLDKNTSQANHPDILGWEDDYLFFLFPQRIYDKVEEVLQARGLSLEVSCKKLCQMLRDEKLLIPDGSYPCKVKHVGGKSYRLLWIPKQVVREVAT